PRLPALAAGDAAADPAGDRALHLVFPGLAARPGGPARVAATAAPGLRRALRQALRPASARRHPLPARMFAGPTGRPVPGTGAPWGHDRLERTTVRCRRPVRRGPARRHRLGGPHTVQ